MTFKPLHDPTHLYFVTATVLGWKHLFVQPPYAEIVLQSLDWHRGHGRWSLFAFVLMPNHAHFIVRPLGEQTISTVLQSFGSYTAHAILDRLEHEGRTDLLAFFAQRQDQDASKQHQIWLPIEAKNVYSVHFLCQKVEYTHNNPVAKHWHLVDDRADYAYSSACFYDRGESPIIAVDDVREWMV
jgi:putative transposase